MLFKRMEEMYCESSLFIFVLQLVMISSLFFFVVLFDFMYSLVEFNGFVFDYFLKVLLSLEDILLLSSQYDKFVMYLLDFVDIIIFFLDILGLVSILFFVKDVQSFVIISIVDGIELLFMI